MYPSGAYVLLILPTPSIDILYVQDPSRQKSQGIKGKQCLWMPWDFWRDGSCVAYTSSRNEKKPRGKRGETLKMWEKRRKILVAVAFGTTEFEY